MHRLVILHTNDIHSRFEQMPKIAEVIRQRKLSRAPDEVLTIDCGDHLDRARMETEGSSGAANIEIMNATEYDFAVLGNNEGLTFTPETLAKLYTGARFTVIGSNMLDKTTGAAPPWMQPCGIVQKGALRIGLIGLTVPFTSFYSLLGWELLPPGETAAMWVNRLRPDVDLIVVISHLGLTNDERLAREVPGIDVILGAHTHHLLEEPVRIGDTYLCAAGKFGQYVGEVELEYDPVGKRLSRVAGRCIAVDSFEGRRDIAGLVEAYRDASRANLSEVVAVLDEPLPIEWGAETTLGNMLAAGLRKWTGAEIGLVNAGQMLQGLSKGSITREHLLRLCPSPVNPCSMLLRGEHIWRALEEALLDEYQQKEIRGFGFRGERLGTLCVDGLQVEYVPSRAAYRKIDRVTVSGQPLDLNKEYAVGTIDMFTFGIGYTSIREGRNIRYFLPEFLRDVLQRELQDAAAIREGETRHWIAL